MKSNIFYRGLERKARKVKKKKGMSNDFLVTKYTNKFYFIEIFSTD